MAFGNHAKTTAPWKRAAKRPGWAHGLAAGALILLAAADFVMLGDALGQSFGGVLGYVVVVALLAGFVFLPRALAQFLHSLVADRERAASAASSAQRTHAAVGAEEADAYPLDEEDAAPVSPAETVKAVICILLLAATIAGYVAVTDYRLSQAQANEAIQQQTEELRSEQQTENRIVIDSSGAATQASAESQTLLLTVILVTTAVYSFALAWARADAKDNRPDRISAALPQARIEAEREADRYLREHEAGLLRSYASAQAAVDAAAAALEGSKLVLDMVESPGESPIAAAAIRRMVDSARQAAPPPNVCGRPDGRCGIEGETARPQDAHPRQEDADACIDALERLINAEAPEVETKIGGGSR